MPSFPMIFVTIFVYFIYLIAINGQNNLPEKLYRDLSNFNSKILAKSAQKYSNCQQFTPGSKSAILCQGVRQLNTLELLNKHQKNKPKGCKNIQKLKNLEDVVKKDIDQKLNTIYETLLNIEKKLSCCNKCPSGDSRQLSQTTSNPAFPSYDTHFSPTTEATYFPSLVTEVSTLRTEIFSTLAHFEGTDNSFATPFDDQMIENHKKITTTNPGTSSTLDFKSTENQEIQEENQFFPTTTAIFPKSDPKDDTTLLETISNLPEKAADSKDIKNMDGIIVYYPFDVNFRDYGTRHWDAHVIDDVIITDSQLGVVEGSGSNKFAHFSGNGYLKIKEFKNFHWGHKFGASVWFRRTGSFEDYATLLSNGYAEQASWDIRLGREQNGERLGAGIITPNKRITWDYTSSFATTGDWHNVVLTYDGNRLDFYLDGVAQTGNTFCCFGDIVSRPHELVIGTAGFGGDGEFFAGDMDEIALFNRTLSILDVKNLFSQGKRKIEN